MKRLISFIFLLCCICCYSQDFLGNSDYVYAKGVARTQVDAENAALQSLASKIGIKVTNVSTYSITERNGRITEEYNKNIGTNASMSFGDEVQTYVETDRKNVVVYKYINVKQYVNEHKAAYNKYIAIADSISKNCKKIKHSKNLVLGQYYLAYNELNTPLMNAYSDNNYEIKERLLNTAKETYEMDGRYGYPTLMKKTDSRGYFVKMTGEITKSVYGIEYLRDGNWELPFYFYYDIFSSSREGTDNAFTPEATPRCLLIAQSSDIHIRYLYEIEKEGVLYRLNVPENWYFCDITIDTTAHNVH